MTGWLDQFLTMLVQALGNSLWQGMILMLGLWLLMRVSRRSNAATRYGVLVASLVMLATLFVIGFKQALPPVPVEALTVSSATTSAPAGEWRLPALTLPVWLVWSLGMFWLAMAAAKLIRLARSFLYMRRCKREGTPLPEFLQRRLAALAAGMGLSQTIRGGVSGDVPLPVTLGLGQPVILLPEEMLDQLDSEDLDHILLHELSHIRRNDDWTRLLQKFLEALLFFHPAAHWIAMRIDLEREVACDDSVVVHTGLTRPYARCLTKIAGSNTRIHGPLLATGVLPGRSQLTRRIDMLLNKERKISLGISRTGFVSALVLLLALLGLFARATPLIAVSLRDRGMKHLESARQDMQNAEARMLTAVEEKKRAFDEQSLARAEAEAQAAQAQMQEARRRLDIARTEIHGDPVMTAENAPTISEETMAEAEATLADSGCPLEKLRKQQEKFLKTHDNLLKYNNNLLKDRENLLKDQDKLLMNPEKIRIQIVKKFTDVKMQKMKIVIPHVHVRVPKMNMHVEGQEIAIPEINVEIPEENINFAVPVVESEPAIQ